MNPHSTHILEHKKVTKKRIKCLNSYLVLCIVECKSQSTSRHQGGAVGRGRYRTEKEEKVIQVYFHWNSQMSANLQSPWKITNSSKVQDAMNSKQIGKKMHLLSETPSLSTSLTLKT